MIGGGLFAHQHMSRWPHLLPPPARLNQSQAGSRVFHWSAGTCGETLGRRGYRPNSWKNHLVNIRSWHALVWIRSAPYFRSMHWRLLPDQVFYIVPIVAMWKEKSTLSAQIRNGNFPSLTFLLLFAAKSFFQRRPSSAWKLSIECCQVWLLVTVLWDYHHCLRYCTFWDEEGRANLCIFFSSSGKGCARNVRGCANAGYGLWLDGTAGI